jgi:hypothetical protein
MSNPLTYDETMALAKLIPFDTQGNEDKLVNWILWKEDRMSFQPWVKFNPFDSRWCGEYIENKLGCCEIELDQDDNWTCRRGEFNDEEGTGDTPTEAVARCVLAVMRDRGEVGPRIIPPPPEPSPLPPGYVTMTEGVPSPRIDKERNQ